MQEDRSCSLREATLHEADVLLHFSVNKKAGTEDHDHHTPRRSPRSFRTRQRQERDRGSNEVTESTNKNGRWHESARKRPRLLENGSAKPLRRRPTKAEKSHTRVPKVHLIRDIIDKNKPRPPEFSPTSLSLPTRSAWVKSLPTTSSNSAARS